MTQVLRTPDEAFSHLPGYPFAPNYLTVSDDTLGDLRVHYLDEGQGPTVLLLHGEPSWSYLYRKMIPPLVAAGYRCVAPDLIGFGRSDKPTQRAHYSYDRHLDWLGQTLDGLNLNHIHLFCQDWGGLLGLRLVAAQPNQFASVCASNTVLPTGQGKPAQAFIQWRDFSQSVAEFPTGKIIGSGCARPLSDEERGAYDAPFPDETYKAGARAFPPMVPITEDIAGAKENQQAWASLGQWEKPFLTLFGDSDPIMAGIEKVFQQHVPGCKNQPHAIIADGGHFIQEDAGEALVEHLVPWLNGLEG
ncbi:MAG: haloalkane dehalogenase [Lysobacterales bacterium]